MEECIAVEGHTPQHFHDRAFIRHFWVERLAARHDFFFSFDTVEGYDRILEDEEPARADDFRPALRFEMRLDDPGVMLDLVRGQPDERRAALEDEVDAGCGEGVQQFRLCGPAHHEGFGEAVHPVDHRDDRQAKLDGKREVAVVVGGHGHNRARPIGDQHVIRDPDRDARVVDRVDGIRAGEDAGLLFLGAHALDLALAGGLDLVGFHRLAELRLRNAVHQRVLRRQHHKRRAPERVGPGGEHHQISLSTCGGGRGEVFWRNRECHFRALAALNPVVLREADFVGPVDLGKIQQLIGVLRDPPEPLLQIFLEDRRAAAFADMLFADDLLARQRGLAVGAVVHRRFLAVCQPHLVELEEEPLTPAVIAGQAGDSLALPIDHHAHRAQLLALAVDVGERPRFGMNAALDGGVLGGQAESVEPHREEDVVALHTLEARAHIAGRHRIPVADVDVAARVWQHRQRVELGLAVIDHRTVAAIGFP